MSDEHKARALLDKIREPHMHDAAFAHIAAALSAAYARGIVKGLSWAREIAGTMAERPYDNDPEFSAVLHVEAAINACLSAIPLSPIPTEWSMKG